MRLPFISYLLCNQWALNVYEHKGENPSVEEIKRNLYTLARCLDMYKPDYCFVDDINEEMQDVGVRDEHSLSLFLVKSLKWLAKRYLLYLKGRMYVKKEMLEEWMEVVKVFPPLVIEAAFFLDNEQLALDETSFFRNVLRPLFANTAIRRPYHRNLEKLVEEATGLSDLHIHINGTSETDMIWWSQIGEVDIWSRSFDEVWGYSEVNRQREQLSEVPLSVYKKRLRDGKKLLNDILKELTHSESFKMLFKTNYKFLHPKSLDETPRLALGAYFYIKVLQLLVYPEHKKDTSHKFYHLLLILGDAHRMIVQQKWQKGFPQFQMITENGYRWRHEEKNYESRFAQLSCDNGFRFLRYIEGRFSPKLTFEENMALVNGISKGFKTFKDKNNADDVDLRLIAHFIKMKDRYPNYHFCRHRDLRVMNHKKALALNKMGMYLEQQKRINIVGIDAAANEMDAGPEVFAPTFHWLREKWRKRNRDLHFTFHAGEDFRHIFSGLRMMVEAVDFLEMEQGDRIGHGTAAGISPQLWMERMDGSVKIRKGEWLDDLVMVHELILRPSNPYADLVELMPRIHAEIMDLFHEIYDDNNSVSDMVKAWQMRRHEPKVDRKDRSRVERMFWDYHFNSNVKKRYNQMMSLRIRQSYFSTTHIEHLQNLVLDYIAHKDIAIEVPLSSNVAISFYNNANEHHLQRWMDDSSENDLLIPPIVVGTDDPGIFMTNIYIEYARISSYLESHGYGFNARVEAIKNMIKTSNYYCFKE